MSDTRNQDLEQILDRAISEIQSEELSDQRVAQSTDRVLARLKEGLSQAEAAPETARAAAATPAPLVGTAPHELRSCEDYQALMPALVAGTLPAAKKLLVEDHARHCIPCRKALVAVRSGKPVAATGESQHGPSQQEESSSDWRRPVLAAAGFILALLASWFGWTAWPAQQDDLFQVRSFDGRIFEVSEDGLRPLQPGDWVDGRREIRIGKGGSAQLQLADGSLVEVAQRSALEMVRRRSGGTLIRIGRGSVIVEASEQGSGHLDVSTAELLASVKGTIFAVSHGSKGSRVSVIEGEVQVEHGRQRTSLLPGDQLASRVTLAAMPFAREIGWSHNAERYIAMLEEFRQLRADLNQLMEAEPRYSTRLLDLAPAETVFYVALPNPTATLSELYQLIRDRVAANPALFDWWQEVESSDHLAELDSFVSDIQELSGYLGDETVIALAGIPDQEPQFPVVMSEVTDAVALRAALEVKLAEIQAEHPDFGVVLLDPSTTTVKEAGTDLFVWIGDDLLVAAGEISEIHRIANGGSDGFEGTPFHARLAEAYAEGAEYLGAIDLATVFAQVMVEESVDDGDRQALEFSGFGDVQHLIVERSQDGDRAHTAADLSFAGPRTGIASWLAAPGPMGALEFFSPDTTFVGAFVSRDPAAIIDEIFELAASQDASFESGLAEAEAEIGVDIRNDLIATLGGEIAAGIDGPALPIPSWKIAMEVYDAARLQSTLELMAERINQEQAETTVTLTSSESNGRIFYHLSVEGPEELPFGSAGLVYSYVHGYLIAAPSQVLIERAIQYRDSGSSVLTSDGFQELLPTDGYLDFSAVVYNRIGEVVSSIASNLPLPAELTAEQRATVDGMISQISDSLGPSLYCLYGDEDRIRLVSNSPSMLPFAGLESVFGIGALMEQFEGISWQQ